MTFKRKAILIAAHSTKHGQLPGAKQDLILHRSYLASPLGGAWDDSEFAILENPTARQVRDALQAAKDVEFAFIAFSGHGEHHIGKQLSDTSLCLNDTEEMYVGDLNPGTKRQVVIIDTCRKVVVLHEVKKADFSALAANRAQFEDWSYRYMCRALFDSEISQAEEGRVSIFSCGLDQSAQETEDGGVFTKAMVDAARAWKDLSSAIKPDSRPKALAVPLVFDMAKTKVPAPQVPILYNGRRMRSFPYGVSP